MSYAKITAFGNCTRDPELKNGGAEKAFCNFGVAVNRRSKSGEDKTTFLNCKAFGNTAENIAKFFRKGSRIIIASGELEEERWQDKATGQDRSRITVIVKEFDFPEKRDASAEDHGDEDVPF